MISCRALAGAMGASASVGMPALMQWFQMGDGIVQRGGRDMPDIVWGTAGGVE